MARRALKPHRVALIKVSSGRRIDELLREPRRAFAQVKLVKPTASRARSPEMYLLAMDYRLV